MARVIDEIRDFDPGFEVVVVDDGSGDRTTEVAEEKGARVLTLPYNLGIGGSVQTAFRYALENDFELAVRLDGDGQHDAAHLPALIAPVLDGEADVAVGSRYLADGGYKQSAHRNIGNRILAGAASLVARQHVTDPSSGFQALNRDAIELFANDYPARVPRGGGDRARREAPPAPGRGSGADARAPGRARRPTASSSPRTFWPRCCSRSSSRSSVATPCRERRGDAAHVLDRRRRSPRCCSCSSSSS